MKTTAPLLIIGFVFTLISFEAKAQYVGSSVAKVKKEYIAYANVLNPLLFGKAGGALSIRNPRMDYFIYGNYCYRPGAITTRIKISDYPYGMPRHFENATIHGFELGTQFRFRNPLLRKPYAQYVQNLDNTSSFYGGIAIELNYARVLRSPNHYSYESGVSSIWEPFAGGIMGWTLHDKRFFFDTHICVGVGASFIHFKPDVNNRSYDMPVDFSAIIFKYEIGFLIGYKL